MTTLSGHFPSSKITKTNSEDEKCLTFLEVPLLFEAEDVLDFGLQLKRRCFDKILVTVDPKKEVGEEKTKSKTWTDNWNTI